jgi:hypothetical protein
MLEKQSSLLEYVCQFPGQNAQNVISYERYVIWSTVVNNDFAGFASVNVNNG